MVGKVAWTGCCAFIQCDVSRMLLACVHVRRDTVQCTCARHASGRSGSWEWRVTEALDHGRVGCAVRHACRLDWAVDLLDGCVRRSMLRVPDVRDLGCRT